VSAGLGATPGSAEEDVQRAARAIHEYLPTVRDAHQEVKRAAREYSQAKAKTYIGACQMKRPVHMIRSLVEDRTQDERAAAEDAEVLYAHALNELDALRGDLMACQSVLRSVTATFAPLSSGVGR
jgi:hypothetical protein